MKEVFEYRGIKYIIKSHPTVKFIIECPLESKHFQRMSDDEFFLSEDAHHAGQQNWTDEQKIESLHKTTKGQIDELLNETIIDRKQSIKKLENETKQLEIHKEKYPKVS